MTEAREKDEKRETVGEKAREKEKKAIQNLREKRRTVPRCFVVCWK